MSFKRTIVIAILFLIVGGLYYHFQIKEKPKQEEQKLKEITLFTIKAEDIKKLKLNRYPEEFTFEKNSDGSWTITNHGPYKADMGVLGNIIQMTANLQRAETVEDKPADLKQYGLEIPKYELSISDGKNTQTIQIGAESIGNKFLYAKMADSPAVFLVDSGIGFNLKGNTVSFRDKSLFSSKLTNPEKIALHTDGSTYMFENKGEKWSLTQPPVPRADDDMASGFILNLMQQSVQDFIPDSPAERKRSGLDKAGNYLEIYEKGKTQPIVLRFTLPEKKEAEIYAIMDGSNEIFRIAPQAREILEVSREKLIKKSLFDFEVDKLVEVTFKWGSDELTIKKETMQGAKGNVQQASWNMVSPVQKGLENEDVFGIIANIRNFYIRDAFFFENNPGKFGLDKPVLTATGKRDDGKTIFTLTIGAVSIDPKFCYVRANDENTVEIIQKETVDSLIGDLNKIIGKEKPVSNGKNAK
jgi:hypothetical protein